MSDFVSILTPPGRSALATLTATGPGVWDIVRRHFRPAGGALPESPVMGRFWLGRLGADLADEVVLAVVGADRVEIHGHGGEEISRCLVELFTSAGALVVEGIALLGASDAAPRLLPFTTTTRTASIVLDQVAGAWTREVRAARLALEAGDFSSARSMIEALASRWHVGRHVVEPFRVVIAGAPNVGKSSLANAITGYQRSIVAPTPGTTRDLVSTSLAVEGWPIVLTDTAGLRFTGEDLEGRGIDQARGALAEADVVLWVVDSATPPVWGETIGEKTHVVLNKIDLPPAWDTTGIDAMRVSAATGAGVANLVAALGGWLVPELPPDGAGVPLTAAQADGLRRALDEPGRAVAILAEIE